MVAAALPAAPAAPAAPKAKSITSEPPRSLYPAGAPRDLVPSALNPILEGRLAATFRHPCSLASDSDLEETSIDTVPGWGSLAHLRLAMEVERALGLSLPGTALASVASYPALRSTVTRVAAGEAWAA